MFHDCGMIKVNGYSFGRSSCLDEHLQYIDFDHCEVVDISLLIAVTARYGYCFQLSFSSVKFTMPCIIV